MPFLLQPHNWGQAIRPNLYNVDYRRVGAYKGMGAYLAGLGQADPITGAMTPQGMFGPIAANPLGPVAGFGSKSV